jgi:metal transporter CNNM
MASKTTGPRPNGFGTYSGLRTVVIGLARALFMGISTVSGAPLNARDHHDNVPEAEGPSLLFLYITSAALVLLGGAFAGLTIA